MKIAVFDDLPDGGAKRVVWEEVKRLSKNHELYHMGYPSSLFATKTYCQKERYFKPPQSVFIRQLWAIWHGYRCARWAYRQGCSLILVHPSQVTQAPWILFFSRLPTLYFCHELQRLTYDPASPLGLRKKGEYKERVYRWWLVAIDRFLAQRASYLLTNSHYSQGQLWLRYNKLAQVIYPGVDRGVFRVDKKIKKDNYALFIGRHNTVDGWDKVRRLSFSVKSLYFESKISDQQLCRIYQQASVLLAMDIQEPFGLKVIEALSCGTDVIAWDDGGYREIAVLNGDWQKFSWARHVRRVEKICLKHQASA